VERARSLVLRESLGVVELFLAEPFEAAAVSADRGGKLEDHLAKPRSDQMPTAIQAVSADLVELGLIQAIDGRIGQPFAITGGWVRPRQRR
jgi:hypothetical protein